MNETGIYNSLLTKFNITNVTENEIKSISGLSLFYADLKYNQITQTPKTTFSALVSNIGGSLGVFLEMSFVSVYRFLNFIIALKFKL